VIVVRDVVDRNGWVVFMVLLREADDESSKKGDAVFISDRWRESQIDDEKSPRVKGGGGRKIPVLK